MSHVSTSARYCPLWAQAQINTIKNSKTHNARIKKLNEIVHPSINQSSYKIIDHSTMSHVFTLTRYCPFRAQIETIKNSKTEV